MKKILIFGAASAIATEVAKSFARNGAELFLVDLKISRLEAVKKDITARHQANIHLHEMNALDYDKHEELFALAEEAMGSVDAFLIAHGTLASQAETQADHNKVIREFNINCVSVVSLASVAANYFEPKGKGMIAAISSVAGDRGRQSNYIYGSAKGGVTRFLQGLRNRLAKSGVNVLTIKPGQVDTPMTADMPKSPLFAKPEIVGHGIYKAMIAEKDVVYIPGYWALVMHIIRHIPEAIFKKLSL